MGWAITTLCNVCTFIHLYIIAHTFFIQKKGKHHAKSVLCFHVQNVSSGPVPQSSQVKDQGLCIKGQSRTLMTRRPDTGKPGGHRIKSL